MDRDQRRWKRVARMQGIRDCIAEWAARETPDELREGIQQWIGGAEATEELALQGVAFALTVPLRDDRPTLIERYRQTTGKLPRADRVVFEAWQNTWFTVGEVLVVEPGHGFRLQDVVSNREFEIQEVSASRQLQVGDWLATLLMPIDGRVELEGTSVPLRGPTRIAAVQAYLSGMENLGLSVEDLRSGVTKTLMGPVIGAVRQRQRRPNLLNHDRERIELVDMTLDVAFARVQEAAAGWADAVVADDVVTILGRYVEALTGPVSLVSFYCDPSGRAILTTNSRARFERISARWEEDNEPFGIIEQREHPADSDPEGPDVLMDASYQNAESVEAVEEEFRSTLASNWLDNAIPALGGLTPREAADAGRTAEVRALLPDMLGEDSLAHIRSELGMRP